MISICWGPKVVKVIQIEHRREVARDWKGTGGANMELLFNGYRVQLGRWKSLEGGWCDGHKTIWMYLMPLNCTH